MRIALGTDKGVTILESGATPDDSWKFISQAYQNRRIQCIIESYKRSILITTSQGAIYKTKDYRNWMAAADGLDGLNITSICSHPNNPMVIYAGTEPPQLYYSDTAGLRWVRIESFNEIPGADTWNFPEPPYRARLTALLTHATYPNVVLAGISRGGFMGSLDGGATWMERHIDIEREVNALVLHPANPNRIFAATSTGIYRSDDLGSTWVLLKHGLPYSYARCMVIAPDNPDNIMCCLSQQRAGDSPQALAFSSNGGINWEIKVNGLPGLNDQPITCMDACGASCFAFSTVKGNVFFTANSGLYWRNIHRGTVPARSILLQDDDPVD